MSSLARAFVLRSKSFASVSLLGSVALIGMLALTGCDGSSSDDGTGASGASGSGGSGASGATGGTGGGGDCPEEGSGTIEIQVNGMPEGVAVNVHVDGPEGGFDATEAGTHADQAGGTYDVVVDDVSDEHPIVRTLYRGSPVDSVCVRDGETTVIEVDYAAVPTSGMLWAHGGGVMASMVGFGGDTVEATSDVDATLLANVHPAKGYAFQSDGTLWVVGGTTADPTLAKYSPGVVATPENPAEVEIVVLSGGCLPDANRIAFDASGNLWLSRPCKDDVVRVSVDELSTTGEVTPSLVLGGVASPGGIAFDAAGNLWVATETNIAKFGAAQLSASAAMPELTIDLIAAGDATAADPMALAFDAEGNLWATVNANYNFAKIAAADLSGTGAKDVAPAGYVSIGVSALPEMPAFDESGALWFAGGLDWFGRLTTAQLAVNSNYAAPTAPEVVITSADIHYAGDIAFYPSPAGLPLASSVP